MRHAALSIVAEDCLNSALCAESLSLALTTIESWSALSDFERGVCRGAAFYSFGDVNSAQEEIIQSGTTDVFWLGLFMEAPNFEASSVERPDWLTDLQSSPNFVSGVDDLLRNYCRVCRVAFESRAFRFVDEIVLALRPLVFQRVFVSGDYFLKDRVWTALASMMLNLAGNDYRHETKFPTEISDLSQMLSGSEAVSKHRRRKLRELSTLLR